jgi:hypothetical protein
MLFMLFMGFLLAQSGRTIFKPRQQNVMHSPKRRQSGCEAREMLGALPFPAGIADWGGGPALAAPPWSGPALHVIVEE